MAGTKTKSPAPKFKPFAKGDANPKRRNPGKSGRQKGTPNKFTRDIREAIVDTLFDHLKGVTWLKTLGIRDPKAFAQLVGKAMPMQIEGSGNKAKPIALNVGFVAPTTEEEDK